MTAPEAMGDTSHEPLSFRSYQTEIGLVRHLQAQMNEQFIPDDERWLYDDADAYQDLLQARREAAAGDFVKRPSYIHLCDE